ncbi:MAG: Rv3654c family TadE-like protein [Propionicimonas sp.]|nr:flp pilus-assembly TadE/G-like family protein [Propionicimonas sp.]
MAGSQGFHGRPRGCGAEAGSGTLLVAAAVLVAGVGVAVVLLVATALAGWQRVRGAADLVALSGAVAFADGRDACRAAARLATDNQVELRRCTVSGDLLGFAVTVEVGAAGHAYPLPADLTATARAGTLEPAG